MKFFISAFVLGLALAQDSSTSDAAAATTTASGASPTTSSSSTGDACGALRAKKPAGGIFIPSEAFACIKAVPFKQADAQTFMQKYMQFVTLQTTIGWLKDPPSTYKQPGFDLLGSLNTIWSKVNQSSYTNFYDFEYDLSRVAAQTHDYHFNIDIGAAQQWNFFFPYRFTSLSTDGSSVPKVYAFARPYPLNPARNRLAWADDLGNITNKSPVSKINGRPVVDFLNEYATNNSQGLLEPHADWNQMMYSPVADLGFSALESTHYYNGLDSLTLEFESGKSVTSNIVALFTPSEIPQNGEEYYTSYVLSRTSTPAAATPTPSNPSQTEPDPNQTTSSASESNLEKRDIPNGVTLDWSTDYPGTYPKADVGIYAGGHVSWFTGYYFDNLGVASLPSFTSSKGQEQGSQAFQVAIRRFIEGAQARNITKIIIDIRNNGGGVTFTGAELFKQFFPGIFPNDRVRFRLNRFANLAGAFGEKAWNAKNADVDQDAAFQLSSFIPWTPQVAINPSTNLTYKSWSELSPGYSQKGDDFTNNLEYDFPNATVDEAFTGNTRQNGIAITGFTNLTAPSTANWGPNDIAILTDGICGSTCAWFADLFRVWGQGKMITVGGLPQTGGIQAYSGVRGNNVAPIGVMNDVIGLMHQYASQVPDLDLSNIPPATDIFAGSLRVNFRDTLRPGSNVPNQMSYIPADCRIFYTKDTVNNYTALWQSAANALWKTSADFPMNCVDGSTGLKEQVPDDPSASATGTATGTGATPSATGKNSAARLGYQSVGGLALLSVAFMFL